MNNNNNVNLPWADDAVTATPAATTPAPAPTQGGQQMSFLNGFNDALNSEGTSSNGLPVGEYDVQLHGFEVKVTKTGSVMATVEWVVADGNFTRKHEWQPLFLQKKDGSWNKMQVAILKEVVAKGHGVEKDAAKDIITQAMMQLEKVQSFQTEFPTKPLAKLNKVETQSKDGNATFTNYKIQW